MPSAALCNSYFLLSPSNHAASFPVQPVQGFDYAKQHMGQTGEEALTVTKETLVLSLPVRDAPLTQDRVAALQDGTASKRPQSTEMHLR